MKSMIPLISVSEEVAGYIMDIIAQTRQASMLMLGVSTRGAIALYKSAQVTAALNGRDFVIPEDVRYVAPHILGHRIAFNGVARAGDVEEYITQLLDQVTTPLENVRS